MGALEVWPRRSGASETVVDRAGGRPQPAGNTGGISKDAGGHPAKRPRPWPGVPGFLDRPPNARRWRRTGACATTAVALLCAAPAGAQTVAPPELSIAEDIAARALDATGGVS